MNLTFTVDCEYCGLKAIRQTSEPQTKFLRIPRQQSIPYTVCQKCAKLIDASNKPFEDAENEADLQKAAERKLSAEANKRNAEAAKEAEQPGVMSALAAALSSIAEGQNKIIELLQKDAKPASRRRS